MNTILLIAISTTLFCLSFLFINLIMIGWRLFYIIEQNRFKLPSFNSSSRQQSQQSQQSQQYRKVDELAPEILAPSLKKPPRPPGGFGSKNV